jgi:glycosyltransferase involved in cell wall biosynthesis
MAMRKCVVSTSIGAEGLPLTAGVHLVIADSDTEFAKKVIELLRDDSKRHRIADAGYRLVKEKYSWRAAAETLSKGLQTAIGAATNKDVQRSNLGA